MKYWIKCQISSVLLYVKIVKSKTGFDCLARQLSPKMKIDLSEI